MNGSTGDAGGGRRDRLMTQVIDGGLVDESASWRSSSFRQKVGGLGIGSFDLLLPCQSDMNFQGETSLLCVL